MSLLGTGVLSSAQQHRISDRPWWSLIIPYTHHTPAVSCMHSTPHTLAQCSLINTAHPVLCSSHGLRWGVGRLLLGQKQLQLYRLTQHRAQGVSCIGPKHAAAHLHIASRHTHKHTSHFSLSSSRGVLQRAGFLWAVPDAAAGLVRQPEVAFFTVTG